MTETVAKACTLGPAVMFTPADRPERYAKALDRADAVILDLEDAVTAADRPAAREAVAAAWTEREDRGLDAARVVVRVNPADTEDHAADVQMLQETGWRTLMLAKAESAVQVDRLVEALGEQVNDAELALAQAPDQVEGLVGCDAAADDEEDAAVGERFSHDGKPLPEPARPSSGPGVRPPPGPPAPSGRRSGGPGGRSRPSPRRGRRGRNRATSDR